MAPDLSEKFLGIDIDDDERRRRDADGADEEQEELVQFVFFGLGEHRFAVPVDAVRTLEDVPDELTRVPRAPPAIEGMMDLRGEITAVVDPRVHFPNVETVDPDEHSGRERLLVLDRPADQQSAAIHVDDVIGVETVPESDVVDDAAIDDRPLSGRALAHPLVAALIAQRREPEPELGEMVAPSPSGIDAPETADVGEAGGGAEVGGGGSAALSSRGAIGGGDDVGTTFELDEEEPDEPEPDETDDADATQEVVLEATPLVDVDSLLLASGQPDQH